MTAVDHCQHGRAYNGGRDYRKLVCKERPEPGSIFCPEHRAAALQRVSVVRPPTRPRPWPGLSLGGRREVWG